MLTELDNSPKIPYSLPQEIKAYERDLKQAREEITNIVRVSDGLLFGVVGLDAFLGVIPGVGALYTFFASCWMFALAVKVKTPLGDLLTFIFLTSIDMGFGVIPAAGDLVDALMRIHSWFGNQLLATIERKLNAIARANVLASNGESQDLAALKSNLFK